MEINTYTHKLWIGLGHEFPKNKNVCLNVHKLLIKKQGWMIMHCKMTKIFSQLNAFAATYKLYNNKSLS